MERYKRLLQFFSSPEKTLKDLYPFQIYSNNENSFECNEHKSIHPLQSDHRSVSEHSVSRGSSQSHYSRTFILDDPPSRLELKRRPRKGVTQNALQIQGHAVSSGNNMNNHFNVKTAERERQLQLYNNSESVLSPLAINSSNNGGNLSPRDSPERTRKRRRSPDTTTGNTENQSADISTTHRRKSNISKGVEKSQIIDFSSESFPTQKSYLRLPKTVSPPSANLGSASRQSSRGTSKQHSNATPGSSTPGRTSAQSIRQSARSSGKLSNEASRQLAKTKNDSRLHDFSQTKRAATTKQVTVKNRQDLHYKDEYDSPQSRSSSASYASSNRRSTHISPPISRPSTKNKIHSTSTQDTAHKNTKHSKHMTEETTLVLENIGDDKSKAQQNIKYRKLKRQGANTDLALTDETILLSSKSEKEESFSKKTVTLCETKISQIYDQIHSRTIPSPPITSTETAPNALFSPLNKSLHNPCLSTEGQSSISSLNNKNVACILDHSGEAQKWSVQTTSSWRSTGSESTEGESLLDLDKFKQAVMSVEIPAEYLEQPEETETSENIFNILETISESPLEECATVQTPLASETDAILNETSCNNNTIENLSQKTLNGYEDLSDIQCTYVYGRESKKDQFQLQWITLESTGEKVSEIQINLNADNNSCAESEHNENFQVHSVNMPANSVNQSHGHTEISQHATYITLPIKSPQSEGSSAVHIIVLKEENLTEEQRATVERYKSGMKKKSHRKPTSNTTNQKVGDPIVIPLSGPESNHKSATGFAVLADLPEVPLSVDVDVKSWLSKCDNEETDSVIYVNQPLSKISQNTSLWASQTILDNISESNIVEHGKDRGDDSFNNVQFVQTLDEKAYKWNIETDSSAHRIECYESRVHEKLKLRQSSLPRRTSIGAQQGGYPMKEALNIERPRTAPTSRQGFSSGEEKHSHSHNRRNKSSNQYKNASSIKYKGHSAEELEETIRDLKDYEKLTGVNADSSQRSTSPRPYHRNTKSTETHKRRNRSPSKTSYSPNGDDIEVLFECNPKPKEKLIPNDRRQYSNNVHDGITNRNAMSPKSVNHRENSKRSDMLSKMSGSSCTSERTSCSTKSANIRPKSVCSRRNEESNGGSDTSRETETALRKRNRMRGRSHFKTCPKSDECVSKSTQRNKEKSPKVYHTHESQSSDRRRKLSPDITKTCKQDNTKQNARRERDEKKEGKSSISSHESNALSDQKLLRGGSEQNISHLRPQLKLVTKFREKCRKKDRMIEVLIEQLITLPLSDNTRRRVADKVSTRLEEGSQPHRDYSCSDILDILQMRRGAVENFEKRQPSPREKECSDGISENKTHTDCVCPKDFKIAGAVGGDCLLLTWKSSPKIDEIAGYMVDVDGKLRQHVSSAMRTSALIMDLDLKQHMRLALRTQLHGGGEPTCHPPLELEYEPYEDATQHWSVSDEQR